MRGKKPISQVERTLDSIIVYIFLWIFTLVVFGLIYGYSLFPDIVKNDLQPMVIHTYLSIVAGYAGNKGVLRWKKAKELGEDRRRGQFWVYFCWATILILGVLKQFELINRISAQLLEIEVVVTGIFFGGKFWKKYLEKRVANGKA